jgi:prophage regulatory protein
MATRSPLKPNIAPSRRRLIRNAEVRNRTGLSKTSLWRGGRDGTFPKPVKSSPGCVAWLEDEVEAWIDSRVTARDRESRTAWAPRTRKRY